MLNILESYSAWKIYKNKNIPKMIILISDQNIPLLAPYKYSVLLYTVSDKIKTTYGFDLSVYFVRLAIFSFVAHILTHKGLSFVNWLKNDLSTIISYY
jgi:hypothetical protein